MRVELNTRNITNGQIESEIDMTPIVVMGVAGMIGLTPTKNSMIRRLIYLDVNTIEGIASL